MKQTFLDIVKELGPNIALSELVYRFVFVWTEDYECERYLIEDQIPKEAQYFWVNKFKGKKTKGNLYKFERSKTGWMLAEKSPALTYESFKRIRRGPAFKEVPPVLQSWEHLWPDYH